MLVFTGFDFQDAPCRQEGCQMEFFRKMIDVLTLGSDRPVRRLVAYYVVLAGLIIALSRIFPIVDRVFGGQNAAELVLAPQMVQDGLAAERSLNSSTDLPPRLELTIRTAIILLGTLVLMLPVSWVYMSTRPSQTHNQSVAQTLLFLPLVVAGIVLIVQNSLALAFSLAGVVAAVRYRTTLRDSRDVVFIFLAIAVGFAAGVETLIVATLVSVIFNFLLILTWRYDFGRNVLEPTAASMWAEPLTQLANSGGNGAVPDRDLVLALDQKQAQALAQRFDRIRKILGPQKKKARYNAILSITTEKLPEAQERVAAALDEIVGRWRLDEVVTNTGKPSELYYLVKLRKSTTRDVLLTTVRAKAQDTILGADAELDHTFLEKAEDAEK
jgi:hypothetical protein